MEKNSVAASSVPFREALCYWVRLGFINFGGPTGQIALMYRELVEERRWISEARFLHALNYCMLLPGPEAQQLAIYIGWLLHRTWGGVAAGVFFILPAVFLLWLLAWIYVAWGTLPVVAAFFYGVKPAVLAVVADATVRIGKKALRRTSGIVLAASAFISLCFLDIPFPLVVLGAGVVGLLGGRWIPGQFVPPPPSLPTTGSATILSDDLPPPAHAQTGWGKALSTLSICGTLWASPLLALAAWRGSGDLLVQEGLFFSKTAMVTFGGAYAVLAYLGQQAVERYQWITAGQMVDGLGLAETTPGPLIMVTQFVGFVGAYQNVKDLPPLLAGTLGAFITTWTTFVPCFLWILLGAPWIERLRGNRLLGSALSAITAAVVGVILNLTVFFAEHTLWPTVGAGLDGFAVAASLAAFAALAWRRCGMIPVIGICALAGMVWRLAN